MSATAMVEVLDNALVSTPAEKLVLLLLADRADPDGYASPALDRLASDSAMTVADTVAVLDGLHAGGWITILDRHTEDGRTLDEPGYLLHRYLPGGHIEQRPLPEGRGW